MPIVIKSLRAEWAQVKTSALTAVMDGEPAVALEEIVNPHCKLSETTVLDPAAVLEIFCGNAQTFVRAGGRAQARRDFGQTDREIAGAAGITKYESVSLPSNLTANAKRSKLFSQSSP